jgi:HNH endonuclease/NUMOD4 motif
MSEVTWLPHPVYTCYEVSDDGRVRSLSRFVPSKAGSQRWHEGRVLRTSPRRGAYLGSTISVNGLRKNFEVHVWVCETFHGLRPSPDLEVRHLNGNPQDNRPENLKWGTALENAADTKRHGTNPTWTQTQCKYGHPYTSENTRRTPNGRSQCRTCYRATVAEKARRGREKRRIARERRVLEQFGRPA